MSYLALHFKVLKDYLLLLIPFQQMLQIMKQVYKTTKQYSLPRGEIKNYNVLIGEKKLLPTN